MERNSLVAQGVKDPALSLQRLGTLLWHRLDPWLRNFHMPGAWQKKKKSGEKQIHIFVFMCTKYL